jgi:hypothetical protein
VKARDLDGRYANSLLHEWFDLLASGKELCCSMSDGYSVADVDWESKGDPIPRQDSKGTRLRWNDLDGRSARGRHYRARQGWPDDGLADLWLWRAVNSLFHAGQYDLMGTARVKPCSDERFVQLFTQHGATETARILKIGERAVYRRREHLARYPD